MDRHGIIRTIHEVATYLRAGNYREIGWHDAVEQIGTHLDRKAIVNAVVTDLAHQVTRLAAAHRPVARLVVLFDEMINGRWVVLAVELLGAEFEEQVKLIARRVFGFYLVRNAA